MMIKPKVIDPNPGNWERCPSCGTKHLAPVREALRTHGGRLYRLLFYQECICGFSTRPELEPCRWDTPTPKGAVRALVTMAARPAVQAPVVLDEPAAAGGHRKGRGAGRGQGGGRTGQAGLPVIEQVTLPGIEQAALPGIEL